MSQPIERARVRPLFGIEVEFVSDPARRRQLGEARSKPLHSPAFLVDRDDQRGLSHGMDVGHQARKLIGVVIVAGEQDDAAHERMAQHVAVLGRQLETCHVDHQGAQGHNFRSCPGRLSIPRAWCAETYQVHRRRVSGSHAPRRGHPDPAPMNRYDTRYTPPAAARYVPRRSKPHAHRRAAGLTARHRTRRAARGWWRRAPPTGRRREIRHWRPR